MPGSQKIHFMPSVSKAAPIRNRRATVPNPWNDHTAPKARPRFFRNHKVTPETVTTVYMAEAIPNKTPK